MSIDSERLEIESEMLRLLVQSRVATAQLRDTYLTQSERDARWEAIGWESDEP